MALQILLGVEAWMPWMRRVFDASVANSETMGVLTLRSLHYLVGTLLFANVVVIALKAHRGLIVSAATLAGPAHFSPPYEGGAGGGSQTAEPTSSIGLIEHEAAKTPPSPPFVRGGKTAGGVA